jgi:hypothetical protein
MTVSDRPEVNPQPLSPVGKKNVKLVKQGTQLEWKRAIAFPARMRHRPAQAKVSATAELLKKRPISVATSTRQHQKLCGSQTPCPDDVVFGKE